MPTSFTINGKTYRSLDEMPADVRRQYDSMMQLMADRDGNGVPDIVERPGGMPNDPRIEMARGSHVIMTSTRVFQDGKEVASADLPADVREQISKAFGDTQATLPKTTETPATRWALDDARPLPDELHREVRTGIWLNWPSLLLLLVATALLTGAAVWVVLRKPAP